MPVILEGPTLPDTVLLIEQSLSFQEAYDVISWPVAIKPGLETYYVPMFNWNPYPIPIIKGQYVGNAVQCDIITPDDVEFNKINLLTWNTPEENSKHWEEVRSKLQFGDDTPETKIVREKLLELLKEYHDCFACSMDELGEANDVEFSFEIVGKPLKQGPRRLPHAIKEEVFKSLERDIAAGILVHSNGSEFASPIVPVRKKTGDIRIATDFRLLNAQTKLSAAPLPRIDDIFDSIGAIRPQYFIALDMASGYHQIKMSPEAQKMSAIVSGPYHLEWTRMPYGLSNSPSYFMTYMSKTLAGIDPERIFVFIDDVIIAAETVEKLIEVFGKVLNRLRQKQL